MTLRQFLSATADVSDKELRPALVLGLKTEVPRSRRSYSRFYRRVVEALAESGGRAQATTAVVQNDSLYDLTDRKEGLTATW